MSIKHKTFNTSNGSIQMEIVEADISSATGITSTLEDIFGSINSIAQMVSKGVGKLPKASAPSEIEVEFYIKALDDNSIIVAGNKSGNFHIKLKWGGVGGEFGDILELNT